MKGLYINEANRAAIVSVMSRVREPRKLTEIAWHIPYVELQQVAYTLDMMVIRGEVHVVLDDNAAKRYVLYEEYYRTSYTREGFDPDRFLRSVLVSASVVLSIAAIILILRAIPW